MSKRPSKHLRAARPLAGDFASAASKADGEWLWRGVRPENAAKAYRCPGCDLVIAAGVAHVVVWPIRPAIGSTSAVEDRRHWHTACWARRR